MNDLHKKLRGSLRIQKSKSVIYFYHARLRLKLEFTLELTRELKSLL